ncbi:MAG: HD domain-containing protein [Methanotrichaceae archaeon]|jgi:uncharacterized protein
MCSEMDFDAETVPETTLEEIKMMYEAADSAHDFSHIMRVYKSAQKIGKAEGADMQILLYAALLHDVEAESKLSGPSAESDALRLRIAEEFLKKKSLPEDLRNKVLYAIDVHRFSKGIVPATREAKILQDADRLDAMGAIGIARVFMTGGAMGRKFYSQEDPFCKTRAPDDKMWNLDHFYKKIVKLESVMYTETARMIARGRAAVLKRYLGDLQKEISE